MKKSVVMTIVIIITLTLNLSLIHIDESSAKKYAKNQAATQASNCANNGSHDVNKLPSRLAGGGGSTSCQNLNSQVQGDDNSVSLAEVHDGS